MYLLNHIIHRALEISKSLYNKTCELFTEPDIFSIPNVSANSGNAGIAMMRRVRTQSVPIKV